MKTLRAALASTLSLALVALSPGLGAYHAAAQVVNPAAAGANATGVSAAGVAGVAPAAGAQGSMQLAPLPGLTQAALTLAPNVLMSPVAGNGSARASIARNAGPAPVAAAGRVVGLPAAAVAGAARTVASPVAAGAVAAPAKAPGEKRTALGDLRRDIPDYRGMATDQARAALDADMALRTGGLGTLQAHGSVLGSGQVLGTGGESVSLKKGSRRTPDRKRGGSPHFEEPGDSRGNSEDVSDLDELGNPRREQSDGPDSVSDEFGGGSRGGSDLFSVLPMTLAATFTGVAAAASNIALLPVYLGLIVPSLILHEMGHAWVAEKLGDPTGRLDGRLSFKLRDLKTHIDPFWTLLLPTISILTGGFIFGGARPVRTNPNNFLRPTKDEAKVAFAGPAVNFGLALLGGFAYMGAVSMGLATVGSILALFVYFNAMLGLFNLLPFNPLDGSYLVRAFLKSNFVNRFIDGRRISATLDANVGLQMAIGLVLLFTWLGAPLAFASQWLAGLFMGGVHLLGSAQLATGALPALAALGLMLQPVVGPKQEDIVRLSPGPVETRIAATRTSPRDGSSPGTIAEPVKLLVRLTGAPKPLPRFVHMDLVARPSGNGLIDQAKAGYYADTYRNMLMDLEAAGLGPQVLERYSASAVATYDLINTATIVLPADRVAEFRAAMEARGFRVDANKERRIIEPVQPDENRPDAPSPDARGAVTLPETFGVSSMGPLHEKGRELWGPSPLSLGFFGRLTLRTLRLFGAKLPEPVVAVIDSGIDPKHKVLKHVKESINVTNGKPNDDIGHGTWTHGAVLAYAPWLKSSIHIRAFENGGATTDDILKALSVARERKAIITSNSWGSDSGDPEEPDAKMVYEMSAKEGIINVFAAGNAGSGKNTVGSPAIMSYVDPASGAPRILSVAATDRQKKVAYFSSRGPGSPTTDGNEKYKDWPHRPDLAEVGYNTEAPWPTYMRADRTDPVYGPVKAISGTSMSTPKVAGTISLLAMLFGVTQVGEKLDAIVNAVMKTLSAAGQPDDVGKGFNHAAAAFAELSKTMTPVLPLGIARFALRLLSPK
ncbi:MAG: S8 family serine peptidase [Elusimicrobia bacterium]|nr:S8 family serine peptidase [Elusimicrobiota bacterium]